MRPRSRSVTSERVKSPPRELRREQASPPRPLVDGGLHGSARSIRSAKATATRRRSAWRMSRDWQAPRRTVVAITCQRTARVRADASSRLWSRRQCGGMDRGAPGVRATDARTVRCRRRILGRAPRRCRFVLGRSSRRRERRRAGDESRPCLRLWLRSDPNARPEEPRLRSSSGSGSRFERVCPPYSVGHSGKCSGPRA
jgi:hypothetical protein